MKIFPSKVLVMAKIRSLIVVFFGIFLFLITGCQTSKKITESDVRVALAQKLMLDVRYYCPTNNKNQTCTQPLTKLTDDLANMISKSNLGGIILFSDNLTSPEQITHLTYDLQNAAQNSSSQIPLFISVDQEGGRVVRLPREHTTSFSGNMAIGATFAKHQDKFAKEVGQVLGAELSVLGFNVNHAPTVDVNVNAQNPVINVRSFGENVDLVSKLGTSMAETMQQQNVISTLKHFPGHGDTNVDSHTGLPLVNHGIERITKVELAPFQYAIDKGIAKMIMTAHIQYPSLDNSKFVSKSGESMTLPATMSRKILTDLLRNKMKFDGVVITDALDMKGISDYFSEEEAVINTFAAGADIALMPFKIRTPHDLSKLDVLLDKLVVATMNGRLDKQEVITSAKRIAKLKQEFNLKNSNKDAIDKKLIKVNKVLANKAHKKIETELALESVTLIKGSGTLNPKAKRIHILMPDENKCKATLHGFGQNHPYEISCSDFITGTFQQVWQDSKNADVLIIGSIFPSQSPVEMGGMDDWPEIRKKLKSQTWPKSNRVGDIKKLLARAKAAGKQSVLISLRAPYEASQFYDVTTDILATYSYNQSTNKENDVSGVAFEAVTQILMGKREASGKLPVTVIKPQ